MNEIIYEPTGNAERGKIHSYHSKPLPRVLSIGAKKKDVEKLKCVKDTSWAQDGSSYSSNYCIGFEVEKSTFHRGAVKEYALFCGFETDSSCGYEAVTNVLPLVPPSYWRNKVFSMFVEAKQILDDFTKIQTKIKQYSTITTKSKGRQDLINASTDNLLDYLKKHKKLSKKQQDNFVKYLLLIPAENSWDACRTIYTLHDHRPVITASNKLMDRLQKAKNASQDDKDKKDKTTKK